MKGHWSVRNVEVVTLLVMVLSMEVGKGYTRCVVPGCNEVSASAFYVHTGLVCACALCENSCLVVFLVIT